MTRHVATIATRNSLAGLFRWHETLRAWNPSIQAHAFTTDLDVSEVPSGVNLVRLRQWWSDDSRTGKARNSPAALKPDLFTYDGFKRGDSVLYTDSADLIFGASLDPLFEECERSPAWLAARPFHDTRETMHRNEGIKNAFRSLVESGPYCNSGVIWCRMCGLVDLFAFAWKALIVANESRFVRSDNLVGDQQDFNLLFRDAFNRGGARCLESGWNIRGKEARMGVFVGPNGLHDHAGKPVYIVHASGTAKGRFDPDVLRYCQRVTA